MILLLYYCVLLNMTTLPEGEKKVDSFGLP